MIACRLATCPKAVRHEIQTEWAEQYALIFCLEMEHNMARSTEKTILFGTAKVDGRAHQWPIAVFNTPDQARHYVTFLRLASRAKDGDAVKALDPRTPIAGTGDPVWAVKYSLTTCPYSPVPLIAEEGDVEVSEG